MRVSVTCAMALSALVWAGPVQAQVDPRDILAPVFNALNSVILLLPAPPPPLADRPPPPLPGRFNLSNFAYDDPQIEAIVTPFSDCELHEGLARLVFTLPINGTRAFDPPPGWDVCWRRQLPPGAGDGRDTAGAPRWTGWNRAYLSTGRVVDSQL